MKFNFKKIASVLASTVMLGSTAAFAAAASYPDPFVKGGNADVAIVWGSSAQLTDLAAAIDVTADLQAELASQTATSSGGSTGGSIAGEAYALFTGSNPIYVNDSINTVRTTITDSELPLTLADTDFSGNVDADVTQTVKLGSNPRVTFAKQPDSSDDDPVLGIAIGTTSTNYLYNATVEFDRAVNLTHADSEGEDITLFGQKFTIGTATDDDELVLFKSSETVVLSVGGASPHPSESVTVDGVTYTVELTAATDTSATVKVTNAAGVSDSKEVNEAASKKINGLEIAVNLADESTATNSISAEVTVGAQKIVLVEGNEVKVGSDEDAIEGTLVSFTSTASGYTGGITKLTVQVFADDTDNDAILEGQAFVDPVFGTFKVDFSGINAPADSTARENIEVKNSGDDKASVTFTNHGGDSKAISFYYNDSATARLADNSGELISVREGAVINKSEFVVVGNEDDGYLVKLKTLSNASSGYNSDTVVFEDAFDSTNTYTATITSEGSGTVSIGGNTYTLTYIDVDTQEHVVLNYPDSSGAQVVIYPTIQTSKGAKVAFYEPLTVVLSNYDYAGTDVTSFAVPDGDGYTPVYITQIAGTQADDAGFNVSLTSGNLGGTTRQNATVEQVGAGLAVGPLTYNFTYSAANTTKIFLVAKSGGNIVQPGLIVFEEEQDDGASNSYQALIVKMEGSGVSDAGVGVSDVETTWGADGQFDELQLETDDDLYESMDRWGTIVTTDRSESDQYTAVISYPDEQVTAEVYIAEVGASITASQTGGAAVKTIGSISVRDSDVAQVSTKNLIVIGGSCVNTVAAKLLGSDSALCGADFTAKTQVGAGQYLIQSFASPYSSSKVATLVAGYNAVDTTNAAKFLTTQTVDTTVGKKYKGSTATDATMVVETA